jgi:hypothetical protein
MLTLLTYEAIALFISPAKLPSMLEYQERRALMLLCCVVLAIIPAYIVLEWAEPSLARPYTAEAPDGSLVVLTGSVERAEPTTTGGHLIMVVDGVQVFIPGGMEWEGIPRPGEQVHLIGTVQVYEGEREIVVQSPDDLKFIMEN